MKKNNRNVRLTRRSFRRKLVMFGVAIFASLSITATGFAAWVLSTDANREVEGGVELGSVSDAGVEIENLTFLDKNGDALIKNFKFEPAAGDVDGRVRADDKGNVEDMDIRIGWTIKNYQNVKATTLEFKVPQAIYNAIQKNYIAVPAAFVLRPTSDTNPTPKTESIDGITYYVYDYTVSATIADSGSDGDLSWTVDKSGSLLNVTFTLNLKFNWGAAFENSNPSLYYDTAYADTTKGVGVDDATVKRTLLDLKATMYGVQNSDKDTAVGFIDNADLKAQAQGKTDILDVLALMSAEEQDEFYDAIKDRSPVYKLVVHAVVN